MTLETDFMNCQRYLFNCPSIVFVSVSWRVAKLRVKNDEGFDDPI